MAKLSMIKGQHGLLPATPDPQAMARDADELSGPGANRPRPPSRLVSARNLMAMGFVAGFALALAFAALT